VNKNGIEQRDNDKKSNTKNMKSLLGGIFFYFPPSKRKNKGDED